MKGRKTVLWGLGLAVVAGAAAWWLWPSGARDGGAVSEGTRTSAVEAGVEAPKPAACAAVSNATARLVRTFGLSARDVVRLDVRKMTCADFRKALEPLAASGGRATLWMPGESDWLVLRTDLGGKVRFSDLMERFEGEDGMDSVAGIFADYVGELRDVLPAFEALAPEAGVAPEMFVTRDLPVLGWLDFDDLDEDIRAIVRDQLRKAQIVRREVLEGCILSRLGKSAAALDKWASAERLNPLDSLLRERLQILLLNAQVFAKVGKYGMAANCYETILCIEPADYAATVNLATCLNCLGKKAEAKEVFARAESLRARLNKKEAGEARSAK